MTGRPRGELDPTQLRMLMRRKERAEEAQADYRLYCVQLLAEGCSFAEVSKATGLSTNTLQRWKRGAADTRCDGSDMSSAP